jgi:arylsulfatase A-like enzyme
MVWYSAVLPDLRSMQLSAGLVMRRVHGSGVLVAEEPILADSIRALSLAYLDDLYASDTPFFFFLHFMDPHAPYKASADFLGKLGGDRPMPGSFASYSPGSTMQGLEILNGLKGGDPTAPEALQILRDRYHEELMMVDAALAEIFARVEASGRPTVILFTADHGEHFAENGLMSHGNSAFAPNIRVPFMIAGPGIAAGELPVRPSNRDVPMTLLHAAGFSPSSFGSGRNLLDPALVETPQVAVHDDRLAVYRDGFKLILRWQASDGSRSSLEPLALYRTADGVAEEQDLLGRPEFASIQATLQADAEAHRDGAVERGLRAFDDAERFNLAEMGYVFDEEGNAAGTDE